MITLKNVSKKFSNNVIFDNLNLEIEEGKITVILGESGCGKTTLLKILLGLTDFDGEIENLPKKLSVVFQENRLIPSLTVKENLSLISGEENIKQDLADFGLLDKENEYVKSLSGGMKRRVAILRAMRFKGDFLILDEPFINLDLKLKIGLMEKIKEYSQKNNVTVLAVTHDLMEATMLADRIIVLNKDENGCGILEDVKKVGQDTEKELFKLLTNDKNKT